MQGCFKMILHVHLDDEIDASTNTLVLSAFFVNGIFTFMGYLIATEPINNGIRAFLLFPCVQ